jgi:hypothetical protein
MCDFDHPGSTVIVKSKEKKNHNLNGCHLSSRNKDRPYFGAFVLHDSKKKQCDWQKIESRNLFMCNFICLSLVFIRLWPFSDCPFSLSYRFVCKQPTMIMSQKSTISQQTAVVFSFVQEKPASLLTWILLSIKRTPEFTLATNQLLSSVNLSTILKIFQLSNWSINCKSWSNASPQLCLTGLLYMKLNFKLYTDSKLAEKMRCGRTKATATI